MRSRAPWSPLLLFVGGVLVVGCANREGTSEYHPSAHVLAPAEVGATPVPTPPPAPRPATSGDIPKTVVAPRKSPASLPSEQTALDRYSARLFTILHAGGADAKFHADLRKVGPQIEKKGIGALLPVYETYARSVRGAAHRLDSLQPPASATAAHKALLTYLTSLADNLESTVDAMKSDDGNLAAQLSKDRNPLIVAKMDEVRKVLRADDFDESAFVANCRLRLRK